jgi:hypothetical protein
MRVKTVRRFFDRETGQKRLEGDEFEVSQERAKNLSEKGFVRSAQTKNQESKQ